MNSFLWLEIMKNGKCAACGLGSMNRSHRRSFFEMYVLRLALLRPFRCDTCMTRAYRPIFLPRERREARNLLSRQQ